MCFLVLPTNQSAIEMTKQKHKKQTQIHGFREFPKPTIYEPQFLVCWWALEEK